MNVPRGGDDLSANVEVVPRPNPGDDRDRLPARTDGAEKFTAAIIPTARPPGGHLSRVAGGQHPRYRNILAVRDRAVPPPGSVRRMTTARPARSTGDYPGAPPTSEQVGGPPVAPATQCWQGVPCCWYATAAGDDLVPSRPPRCEVAATVLPMPATAVTRRHGSSAVPDVRALLAVLVGAGLALVGAVPQAVGPNRWSTRSARRLRASFGRWRPSSAGSRSGAWWLSGAVSGRVTALCWSTSWRAAGGDPGRRVLAVALSYCSRRATVPAAARRGPPGAVGVVLAKRLAGARWYNLLLPAAGLAAGMVLLLAQWRSLNAVMAGTDTATALGVPVHRFRAQMFVLTSLLTGVMVAVTGAIAFVGLIVPHAARMLVGADHRRVARPALLGAVSANGRLARPDSPRELLSCGDRGVWCRSSAVAAAADHGAGGG